MNEEILAFFAEKEAEMSTLMENAEADGNSDYDYYQGCYESYGVALSYLQDKLGIQPVERTHNGSV